MQESEGHTTQFQEAIPKELQAIFTTLELLNNRFDEVLSSHCVNEYEDVLESFIEDVRILLISRELYLTQLKKWRDSEEGIIFRSEHNYEWNAILQNFEQCDSIRLEQLRLIMNRTAGQLRNQVNNKQLLLYQQ
jgi:hypothetical protein